MNNRGGPLHVVRKTQPSAPIDIRFYTFKLQRLTYDLFSPRMTSRASPAHDMSSTFRSSSKADHALSLSREIPPQNVMAPLLSSRSSLDLTSPSGNAGSSDSCNIPSSKHKDAMPHGLSDVKNAFTLSILDLPLFKDNAGSAATAVAPSD